MDRVTFRLPENQIEEIENLVERGRFMNRSEALRSAVRDFLEEPESDTRNRWSR